MSERYSRQILLSEIGEGGQAKLTNSQVAVVGCGGLGAIAASYLAGAGVGKIILVDGDSPCLLYTSPSPRDRQKSRMPSSA